jgi:YVTN family beta-propeller protein
MDGFEGGSHGRLMGAWGHHVSAWDHYVSKMSAPAISPTLPRKWRGNGTHQRGGRAHRILSTLGVLAALALSTTASAGAAPDPSRQTPISLPPTRTLGPSAGLTAAAKAVLDNLGEVSVGSGPTGLAYDAQTHTLYSSNQNANSLSVISTKSCHAGDTKGCAQRVGTVALGSAALPQGVALDTATDTLYVANGGNETISVVNTKTCSAGDLSGCGQAPPTITDPQGPGTGIAVNPLTDTVYAANTGSPYPSTAGHTVSVIDGATCNATTTSGCRQTPPTVTVGYSPASVAVDPANDTVYVADAGIANNFNAVSVIDGATCNATTTLGCNQIPASITVGTAPLGILLDESTNTAYTANFNGASVSVIDIATCNATTTSGCGQKTTTTPVGSHPSALTLDQAHHSLFVADNQDDTLSAIDTATCNATESSSCARRHPTSQVGDGPQALATDPSTGTVYAANFSAGTISVVSANSCNAIITKACRAEAPTAPVGSAPNGVAVDTATHSVYVANQGDNTLSVLDAAQCSASVATGCARPSAIVHVGDGPTGVAVDQATDSVYVANNSGNTVSVINGATCNATDQAGCAGTPAMLTVGNGPFAIGIDSTTDSVYVTDAGTYSGTKGNGDTVSVIDGATCNATVQSGCGQTAGTVTVGVVPLGIDVNPTTNSIYVANTGPLHAPDSAFGHTVSLIDGATCNGSHQAGCGQAAATVTVGVAPFGVAVDQSTNKIYVANNTGGGTPASLSVINGASCDAAKTSGCAAGPPELPFPGFAPNGIALDPTNHVLYTANFLGANVSAIDLASTDGSRSAPLFAVGSSPESLAVDPANHTVYVSNSPDGTVSVVATQ